MCSILPKYPLIDFLIKVDGLNFHFLATLLSLSLSLFSRIRLSKRRIDDSGLVRSCLLVAGNSRRCLLVIFKSKVDVDGVIELLVLKLQLYSCCGCSRPLFLHLLISSNIEQEVVAEVSESRIVVVEFSLFLLALLRDYDLLEVVWCASSLTVYHDHI